MSSQIQLDILEDVEPIEIKILNQKKCLEKMRNKLFAINSLYEKELNQFEAEIEFLSMQLQTKIEKDDGLFSFNHFLKN